MFFNVLVMNTMITYRITFKMNSSLISLVIDPIKFKNLVYLNKVYIIDVRSPQEISQQGHINTDNFINIPLNELKTQFSLNECDFKAKYGIEKPKKNEENICTFCKIGRRSVVAMNMLHELGFTQAKTFEGGWDAWLLMNCN